MLGTLESCLGKIVSLDNTTRQDHKPRPQARRIIVFSLVDNFFRDENFLYRRQKKSERASTKTQEKIAKKSSRNRMGEKKFDEEKLFLSYTFIKCTPNDILVSNNIDMKCTNTMPIHLDCIPKRIPYQSSKIQFPGVAGLVQTTW